MTLVEVQRRLRFELPASYVSLLYWQFICCTVIAGSRGQARRVVMFHPVPRADRWDVVISTAGLVLFAAIIAASFLFAK